MTNELSPLAKEMFDTAMMLNGLSPRFYYDAEFNGKRIVIECKSKRDAEDYLDNMFAEMCEEIEHGEIMEDEAEILKIDASTGDVIGRSKYGLFCEGYHGDYAEHFNQSSFV